MCVYLDEYLYLNLTDLCTPLFVQFPHLSIIHVLHLAHLFDLAK